jgi:hypothetical protein
MPKAVLLNEDVWGIMKSYMGLHTNYPVDMIKVYNKCAVNKLQLSVEVLVGERIKVSTSLDAKSKREIVLKKLYKCISNNPVKIDKFYTILLDNNVKIVKSSCINPNDYALGEEVVINILDKNEKVGLRCGIITKINKLSIKVMLYKYEYSHIRRDDYNGYDRYTWIKSFNDEYVLIKSNNRIYKNTNSLDIHDRYNNNCMYYKYYVCYIK